MKKSIIRLITPFTFAVYTAVYVFCIPAYGAAAFNITVSRTGINEAEVYEKKEIVYSHSGSITVDGPLKNDKEVVILMDTSGSLDAIASDAKTPFDYSFFCGDETQDITISGTTLKVTGDAHSNRGIVIGANTVEFSGQVTEAVTDIVITATSSNITNPVEGAPVIQMPDFSSSLISDSILNGKWITKDNYTSYLNPDGTLMGQGTSKVYLNYDSVIDEFRLTGETFTLDCTYFFEGNLFMSLSGSSITGKGFILTTKNITIQGNSFSHPIPNLGTDNSVCLYSMNGNIRFETNITNIKGIAYAPKGLIHFQGTSQEIYGSVVAKSINIATNKLNVYESVTGLETAISSYIPKPKYLSVAKDNVKRFIDNLAVQNARVSVLAYSNSANTNDFNLYDTSAPANITLLKSIVDGLTSSVDGKSNLGDGLRRAYHLLNNQTTSNKFAAKYIVVLTGSESNRWTSEGEALTTYKFDSQTASFFGGNGVSDVDGKSLEYAREVGSNIAKSDIEPIFISYSPNDITANLELIAQASGAKEVSSGIHYYLSNSTDLSSIFGTVSGSIESNLKLTKVEFKMLLPLDVIAVSVAEGLSIQIDPSTGRQLISGKLKNIHLTKTGNTYYFNQDTFSIIIRFTKVRSFTFLGSDSELTYTVDYTDSSGATATDSQTFTFDDFTIQTRMDIDIG